MTTTPNTLELELLRGIVAVLDELVEMDLAEIEDADERKWYAGQQSLAKQSIVELDLEAFLGRVPTTSERTMASRSWRRLEAMGYLSRIERPDSSLTHSLELLPAGRAAANDPTIAARASTPRTRLGQFLSEACELVPGGEVDRDELYIRFFRWCSAKGITPASLTQFEQQLLALPTVGRVHRQTGERGLGQSFYVGLRLRQ